MPKKLSEYTKKRNLKKSGEPKAKVKKSKKENIFVVQQHHASHMHFDFRIESRGVLKSWAIPKGPSTNPQDKRLAAMTEDHPIEYAKFEGIIPQGYGAGTVIVWDEGAYENLTTKDDKPVSIAAGIKNGHIKIMLHGKKLKGAYALTKFRDKDWLFVKIKDEYANAKANPAKTKPVSVLSKKTIKSIDAKFKKIKKKQE